MTLGLVGRFLIRFGTLGVLAHRAYRLVAVEFRLGNRNGIRSIVALAVPLLVGGYLFVMHRDALQRIGALPSAVRFAGAFAAGALAMASIHFFLAFYPIPIAYLIIASSIAVIAFGSGSLAPSGIAAGMLGYVALFGIPKIVHG